MTTLRLVTFQHPIFATVQGEGYLVGMPSTFVRLHGCDYSCSWCDTKDSWRPGSTFKEVPTEVVAHSVEELGIGHVVITGGNPMLQNDAVVELMELLGHAYHFTIETQGSVAGSALALCDLISLSPKLHQWEWDKLDECIPRQYTHDNEIGKRHVQVKVVVQNPQEVESAIGMMVTLEETLSRKGYLHHHRHFFVQPEYSQGRRLIPAVARELQQLAFNRSHVPVVRVLPQVHKFVGVE